VTPQSTRYDGLDAIRAGAMLLGLAYHATYAWLPNVGPWYFVADATPVEALVPLTGFLHAFRMQLFFALSGFFSHLVFERRGAADYLVDRSRRLLVPLLVALPVVLWLDVQLRQWSHALGLMSPEYAVGTGFRATPLHLWFLIYLWSFCALAWALPRWSWPFKLVERALSFPPSLLLLAAFTCAGLALHPENKPDLHFWPMPFEAFHFGLFFAFGWWLWPARARLQALKRHAGWLLAAGLALGFFVFRGALQWELSGQVVAGLVAWLMTLGALGLAFVVPARERPWLRFLVESSYWVYLVHYPVVLALQVLFAQRAWPGLLEYALATALTFGFALLTFVLFVRRTALGPWLGVKRKGA
jgi:peptidoglycan/LPS O-acetylase OafA/YrhL